MRKMSAFLLALLMIVSLCACNSELLLKNSDNREQMRGKQLLPEGNVKSISVSSLPEGYNYAFSAEDAKAITDYLSALNLRSKFEENPDEYAGMTWVISLEYENGDHSTVYHFGNMFIRSEAGPWYKMAYDEASRFHSLLDELSK